MTAGDLNDVEECIVVEAHDDTHAQVARLNRRGDQAQADSERDRRRHQASPPLTTSAA